MATPLPASDAAIDSDPEWDRVIDHLTAIAAGGTDCTITRDDARMLLGRIDALQVWALERLASDFAEAVYPA